jgi:hypothetical protein
VEEFYVDTATLTREMGLVAVTRGIDLDTADPGRKAAKPSLRQQEGRMNGHGRVTVTLDTDPLSGIEPIVPPELGILAERSSLDPEDARALLERAADASGRSVQGLARDVLSCRSAPLAVAPVRRDADLSTR